MANNNPDTSGLVSLADRTNNERTMIAQQGGIASGKKRKEIKRLYEIIQSVRQESDKDPIERAINSLLFDLHNPNTSTNDIIKGLQFIKSLEPEQKQENQQQVIYKYVTKEEIKAVDEHINSIISNTNDEKENDQ